jgi:hypothetical protein
LLFPETVFPAGAVVTALEPVELELVEELEVAPAPVVFVDVPEEDEVVVVLLG